MIYKVIESKTYITNYNLTDDTDTATLVVTPSHDKKAPDWDKIYTSEAQQVYEFLRSIFCDNTLIELKALLPDRRSNDTRKR